MISAFGVEHEFSKARRHAGIPQARRGQDSMTHRGGQGYFNPTPEQIAAAKARRAQQAADSAHQRMYAPRGGGKKIPAAVHLKQMGNTKIAIGTTLGIGGLSAYALKRRTPVDKALKDEATNTALGATSGGTLTAAGLVGGGQATKIALKNRRARRGVSAAEKKIWREHTARHGTPTRSSEPWMKLEGRKIKTRPNQHKVFESYPKSLPDWKIQRALAFKNRPAVMVGTIAAGSVAGGAIGLRRSKR